MYEAATLLETCTASSRALTSTLATSGEQAAPRPRTSARTRRAYDGEAACTVASAPSCGIHVVMGAFLHRLFAVLVDPLLVVWFGRPILRKLLAFQLQPFYSVPDVVDINQSAYGVSAASLDGRFVQKLVLVTSLFRERRC
jgi:hypothetical protein